MSNLITRVLNYCRENQQDLNLDEEFKSSENFAFETCSVCGRILKHARLGAKGDAMRCSVECRGETAWYCEECAKEHLDNRGEYMKPEDYLKEIDYGNI